MALTPKGKKVSIVFLCLVLAGLLIAYKFIHKEKAKTVDVKTKATALPQLPIDKGANAIYHELPQYGEAATVETPQIRGQIMEWYAQLGILYAVGGTSTTKGSICEELKLNVNLSVQNDCGKQGEALIAFADELHSGNPQPTKGANFIAWMGDGCPSYLSGLNKTLKEAYGDEYQAKVVYFGGASAGEDKWLLKKKYATDARGSLTCTVILDGDWNICIIKSQLMGWPINYDQKTYDPTKVNFVAAPENNYLKAAEFYASGQKVKLKLVKNGVITDKDTLVSCTGVATWFPGDLNAVTQKGGLVAVASTKDFGAQMPCAIIFISKWANDNRELVENFCAAVGLGGDQVKSHKEALEYAAKVGKEVFASTLDEENIVKAYKTYDITDDDGNVVNIGGSRIFNLADVYNFIGGNGGQDKYKMVYNTFGNIDIEAYPEKVASFPAYEEATDYSFFKKAYTKYQSKAGNVSKVDFTESTKSNVLVGDASYSIEFNTGSDVIKPVSYPILDKILAQLNIADNSFVDLAGHTDNTGSDEINIPLSEKRAEAVRQYLIQKDENLSDRISKPKGYGSTKPIADNSSEAGKSKNRRVEIKLFKAN